MSLFSISQWPRTQAATVAGLASRSLVMRQSASLCCDARPPACVPLSMAKLRWLWGTSRDDNERRSPGRWPAGRRRRTKRDEFPLAEPVHGIVDSYPRNPGGTCPRSCDGTVPGSGLMKMKPVHSRYLGQSRFDLATTEPFLTATDNCDWRDCRDAAPELATLAAVQVQQWREWVRR